MHYRLGKVPADNWPRRQNVGIIMMDSCVQKRVRCTGRPAHSKFVCHNRHADSGATDQNPALHLAARDGTGNLFSKIRVINRLRGVGTEINALVSQLLEQIQNVLLHLESGMIGTNGTQHISSRCAGKAQTKLHLRDSNGVLS